MDAPSLPRMANERCQCGDIAVDKLPSQMNAPARSRLGRGGRSTRSSDTSKQCNTLKAGCQLSCAAARGTLASPDAGHERPGHLISRITISVRPVEDMSHRNSTCKRWVAMVGLHLAFLSYTSASVTAQVDRPSAERGKELATRLCKTCHVIDTAARNSVLVGTPTFRSMASAPGQTRERILAALIQPHVPMPDVQLSRSEIDNIIAYLDELRAEQSLPPLQPPTGGAKPTLPSRS